MRFFGLKSCRMITKLSQSIVLMSFTSTNVLGPIRALSDAPRVQKLPKIMIFRSFGAFLGFEKLKNQNRKKLIKNYFFSKRFFLSNIHGPKYMEKISEESEHGNLICSRHLQTKKTAQNVSKSRISRRAPLSMIMCEPRFGGVSRHPDSVDLFFSYRRSR